MDTPLVKTTDASLRCQAIIDSGTRQCIYEKVVNSQYCRIHGGIHASRKAEEAEVKNYKIQIARYQRRIGELANNEGVKSLREEIAILRMTLETIINSCESDNDLLMYSSKISSTCRDIERVVKTCHGLESSLGFLMDRSTVLNISKKIINIVNMNVNDEAVMDRIADSIVSLLSENVLPESILNSESILDNNHQGANNDVLSSR